MYLNVHDRLRIENFVPQQSDRITLTIARDIFKKVKLTQKELKQINLRSNPMNPQQVIWDGDIEKCIDFTDAELKILKKEEKKKNDTKLLTSEDLNISEKIVNAKLSSERAIEPEIINIEAEMSNESV